MLACDSDGCAFDVMDLKHKECFCPAFIKHFQLQRCARQARQVWEFVNLNSRSRGSNRFAAVGLAVELLAKHPDLASQDSGFMDFGPLQAFIAQANALGEPALRDAVRTTGDPALAAMLAWTREVNDAVAAMCQGLGPFPGVADGLALAAASADVVVVSQAPRETLLNEWNHAGLLPHTACVAGQEFGSKAAQIRQAMTLGYTAADVLVVGDAPGDLEAAEAVGSRFFPINPGDEAGSWQKFSEEGFPRFCEGRFDDAYQQALSQAFAEALPENPPWA